MGTPREEPAKEIPEAGRRVAGGEHALPRTDPGRAGGAPDPGVGSWGTVLRPGMSSPPPARKGFYRQEVTKTAWEVRAVYQDLQPVGSGAYGAVW